MAKKDLERSLIDNYMHVAALVRQITKENTEHRMLELFVGHSQLLALTIIDHAGTITQKELVAQLDMRPQSASELIKKLEKKDLLSRVKSPEDGRMMIISLTDEGVKLAEQSNDFSHLFFDSLTMPEKKQFDDLLQKVSTDLSTKVKHQPPRQLH